MATKRIEFKATGGDTVANGADGVLVGGFTDTSYYASAAVVSGFRCGWIGAAGESTAVSTTGAAAPFTSRTTHFPGTPRTLRIDRVAGTFLVKLGAFVPAGTYRSSNIDILDADGTTVLHTMNGTEASGEATDQLFITSGAMVATGTSDAGVTITTTGPQFFVRHKADDTYAATLSYVEFFAPDPAPATYTPPPVVTNPNVDYITGVTLLPITVRVYDQYGAVFTSFVGTCTVSSLSLPTTVTGTLTVSYVSGVATFSDLVPGGTAGPVVIPPVITSFAPLSGDPGTVVTIVVNTDAPLTSVLINGTSSSTILRVSGSTVTAVVPSFATSGPITVVAANGTAVSAGSFFVTVPPVTPTGFVEVLREVPAYTHPSVLRIANLALQRVGATKLIASLDEASKEARTIRQSWDHLRDLVMSEYPWGFATAYAALPVVDITRKPWCYTYRLPADCLFPLGLEVQAHVMRLEDLLPFECQADESGPVLVTDQPDAVLRYLKRLIDPLDWPIWFHELMAWRLASELAMPLTVQPAMKQAVDAGLAQARIMAAQRAATAGQAPAQPLPSAFVTARGGYTKDNSPFR